MPSEALTQALAPTDPTGVEQAEPRTPVALLQSDRALQMIAESLPKGMDASTFQRHAITLVKQTPKLMECDGASVAQGIVRGAALGLDPDPALGQMWLVPRNVKAYNPATRKDEWSSVATFQVGYRGLYELAMRTGRIAKVEVKAVHERDHFEARLGSQGGLDHRPDWFGDRGPVIGWYAYAQLKDGTETFEVLSVSQAEEHRDAFGPKKRDGQVYGPWVDHFDAMASKTVFIKLAKWLPKSVEMSHALDVDGQALTAPLGSIPRAGDIIEASHREPVRPALAAAPEPEGVLPSAEAETSGDDGSSSGTDPLPLADENGEPIDVAPAAPASEDYERNRRKLFATLAKAWPGEARETMESRRHALIGVVTDGRTESTSQLTDSDWRDMFDATDLLELGSMELKQSSRGDWSLSPKPARRAPAVPKGAS